MEREERLREREFDESWKKVLDRFFWQFLEFYFPDAASRIDRARGYAFLDQELSAVTRRAESGKKRVDKLARVHPFDGGEMWLLIHVEVQSQRDADFARRMMQYHYRIYDLHERPVASLAVLADPDPDFRPSAFETRALGEAFLSFRFRTAKILDWAGREGELERDPNPFGVVTLASLRTYEADPARRLEFKFELARMLHERGYDGGTVLALYEFLDGILVLPESMERVCVERIVKYEEERKMPYITSAERIGTEKGIERGIRKSVLDVLRIRFGGVSEEIASEIGAVADVRRLGELHEKAVLARDPEEFAVLLRSGK